MLIVSFLIQCIFLSPCKKCRVDRRDSPTSKKESKANPLWGGASQVRQALLCDGPAKHTAIFLKIEAVLFVKAQETEL